jgi:intracellular sulfur oxidation DsrE/DsrF family protein
MNISRRMIALLAVPPVLAAMGRSGARAAEPAKKAHRVTVQVDSNDPALINLALNNTHNLFQHYASAGQEIEVRIVTFGPGLHMLREDTSPVKDRLASMKKELPGLSLAACANTRRAMEKAEGKPVPITPLADMVPSGVVELVELQEQGWSYLRP